MRYVVDEYVDDEFVPGELNLRRVFSLLKKSSVTDGESFEFWHEDSSIKSAVLSTEKRERILARVRELSIWRKSAKFTDFVATLQEGESPLGVAHAFRTKWFQVEPERTILDE